MDKVNAYMKTYRAPGELRDRVRAYVVHCRGLKREQGFRKVGPALHSWMRKAPTHSQPSSNVAPFFNYLATPSLSAASLCSSS